MKRQSKVLPIIHGTYILVTALWPLLHIRSFMEVTGYKTDIWLVKTVSVILLAIAIYYLTNALFGQEERMAATAMGISLSAGLACIDFYYSSIGRIAWVYAIDGIVEVLFAAAWLTYAVKLYQYQIGFLKPKT
jgi:hypothetical protein